MVWLANEAPWPSPASGVVLARTEAPEFHHQRQVITEPVRQCHIFTRIYIHTSLFYTAERVYVDTCRPQFRTLRPNSSEEEAEEFVFVGGLVTVPVGSSDRWIVVSSDRWIVGSLDRWLLV